MEEALSVSLFMTWPLLYKNVEELEAGKGDLRSIHWPFKDSTEEAIAHPESVNWDKEQQKGLLNTYEKKIWIHCWVGQKTLWQSMGKWLKYSLPSSQPLLVRLTFSHLRPLRSVVKLGLMKTCSNWMRIRIWNTLMGYTPSPQQLVGCTNKCLNELINDSVRSLLIIFERSRQLKEIPAVVTTLFKKCKEANLGNYRLAFCQSPGK